MKKILISGLAFTLVLAGCKKDTFDYKMYDPEVAEIDSVYFSPGAEQLVADGQATLQFVVETYRTLRFERDGAQIDSMVSVDYRKLPAGAVQIFKDGQPYNKMEFSTTEYATDPIQFYVKVGNATSMQYDITLRPKQAVPEKLTVDVIFHVFELTKSDPFYDQLTYQAVTHDRLVSAVEDMNNVFNNVKGNNPNGGTANIHFRLAEKNPAGNLLAQPGYRMITYDQSWKQFSTFSPSDFSRKVNETPSYTWDPSRYLNIYVIPSGANNSMGKNIPEYQIVPAGEEPIPGIPNVIADASQLPEGSNYHIYGVGIPKTLLFPGTDRRIELSPFLGNYYGLKRTGVSSPTATDYCNDTRKYISSNQFESLVKTGIDGMKFLADNAMDDNRYPSLRNSFTIDQVERIRAVMAQCPNRMHGQP